MGSQPRTISGPGKLTVRQPSKKRLVAARRGARRGGAGPPDGGRGLAVGVGLLTMASIRLIHERCPLVALWQDDCMTGLRRQLGRLSTGERIGLATLTLGAVAILVAVAAWQWPTLSTSAPSPTPTNSRTATSLATDRAGTATSDASPSLTTTTSSPKVGKVKLTLNQPGGVDLDTMKPVLDKKETTGDLILENGIFLIDLQPINRARILLPGPGVDHRITCEEPEESLSYIRLTGVDMGKGLPRGSRICVRTTEGGLASLVLTDSRMTTSADDWYLVFDVKLWRADSHSLGQSM